MIGRFDTPEGLPGQTRVAWRRERGAVVGAALAAVAWPPLILTLFVWPPENWMPGLDMDWRLWGLIIGLIASPAGLWLLRRERDRSGRPASRLGVVWRLMLYGGLLAAALEVLFVLVLVVQGWFASTSFLEGVGSTETQLLLYGVLGLPIAILVGVSYALWAGLCIAFIAFRPAPEVRDRLGVIGGRGA